MKSFLVITAFTSGALASTIQLPNILMDRAIDPATMNPTLFSVLSVLKTGMPTGPNVAMPTGGVEPDWYQKLPGDVKSLLPELYPVAAVTVAAMSEAQGVSQVSTVLSQQSGGETGTETMSVSASSLAELSVLSVSLSATAISSSLSSFSAGELSSEPSMAQTAFTKTSQSQSQYTSTATDTISPSSSSSISPSDSASPTTSSLALPSASAAPSSSLSTGARFAVKTETLAMIALSSVGAAFCIFA